MSFVYYNAHPKGKLVGDCVKRAISKVTETDYMEVQRTLNRLKRELGAEEFNSDKVLDEFIKRNGFLIMSFPAKAGEPRMNGERFCQAYPRGRYILRMAGHWAACVDGVIYDTWDCSEKCVYRAFKLK